MRNRPTQQPTERRPPPPVMLGVPCQAWMYTLAASALMGVTLGLPPGSTFAMPVNSSWTVASQRNAIVERFLTLTTFEWLLFIDSDMVPPIDVYQRLVARNLDIVSALCFSRHPPYPTTCVPLAPLRNDEAHGLCEAQLFGFGCVLIRRRVLETMTQPWFAHATDKPDSGEDWDFCMKARRAGFQLWIDFDVEVGHLNVISINQELASGWYQTATGAAQLAAYQRRAAARG